MEASDIHDDTEGKRRAFSKIQEDSQGTKGRKTRSMLRGRLRRASPSSASKPGETQVKGTAESTRSAEGYLGHGRELDAVLGWDDRTDETSSHVPVEGQPLALYQGSVVSGRPPSGRYVRRGDKTVERFSPMATIGVSEAMSKLNDPMAEGAFSVGRNTGQPLYYDQRYPEGAAPGERYSEGQVSTASSSSSSNGALVPYRTGGLSSESSGQDQSFLDKFRQKYAHLLGRPKPATTMGSATTTGSATTMGKPVSSRAQRRPLSTGTFPESLMPTTDRDSGMDRHVNLGHGLVETESRLVSSEEQEEGYSTITSTETGLSRTPSTVRTQVRSRAQRRPVSIGTIPETWRPPVYHGSAMEPRVHFDQGYEEDNPTLDPSREQEGYSPIAFTETVEETPAEEPPPGGYVNSLDLETPTTQRSTDDINTSTLFVDVHLTSPSSPGDPTLRVAESLFQANIKDEQRRQLLRKVLAKFQCVLTSVSGDRLGLQFLLVEHLDRFWAKVNVPGVGSVSDRLDSVLITDQMRVAVLGRKLAVKVDINEEEYLSVRKQLRKCTSGLRRTMTLNRSRFAKATNDKEKQPRVKPSLTGLLKDEDLLNLLRVSKQRDRTIRKLEATSGQNQLVMRRSQSCGHIESDDASVLYGENRRAVRGIRTASSPAQASSRSQHTDDHFRHRRQSLERQQAGLTERLQRMEGVLEQIRNLVGLNLEDDTLHGSPRTIEEVQASSLRPDVVRDLEQKNEPMRMPYSEIHSRQGDPSGRPPIGGPRYAVQNPSTVRARTSSPDARGKEIVPVTRTPISATAGGIDANRDGSRLHFIGEDIDTASPYKAKHPLLDRLHSREKSKQIPSPNPEDMQIVRRTKEPPEKEQAYVDSNTKLRTWKPNLPVHELAKKLSEHAGVQSLDLSGHQLQHLPDGLEQLSDLVRLDLSNNKFRKFPPTLLKLPKIEHINLSRNSLKSFPMEIRLMGTLRNLQLTNMALEEVPTELCDLSNLEVLNIRDNNLTSLPNCIGRLEKLTTLQLSWNKFETLSEAICDVGSLEVLYLDYNQLTDLPRGLGRMVRLRELWLSSNQIQHLPDEICSLLNIEVLSVNNNKLAALPGNICNLSKLWMMHVRNNAIYHLPSDLHRLTNLQVIDVSGNPLNFPPAEVCNKGLSAILDFIRDSALPETGCDDIVTSSAHVPRMSCTVAPSHRESTCEGL